MKVHIRVFNIIFACLIAFIMSLFLSFFMIAVNVGFNEIFLFAWLRGFALSFLISLPIALFIVPAIRKVLSSIFSIDYSMKVKGNIFDKKWYVKQYRNREKTSFTDIYHPMYDALQKHAPEGAVLDIGCGTGSFAVFVAKDGRYEVSAIDPAKNMIAECRKYAAENGVKVDFRIASAGRLPFADESFNMVFSNGALHHWKNPVEAFNEIHRVLKPGGKVMINDLYKDVDRGELDRIVGSRIESPQARQAFLQSAPQGAFSREEVAGFLENSKFSRYEVQQKAINLGITIEK